MSAGIHTEEEEGATERERDRDRECRIASFPSHLTIVLCLFIIGKLLSNEFNRKKYPSQNAWMAGPWHT